MTQQSQTRYVYLSGEMVPESEAKISVFDSAVLLGDCLTESTRTFRHRPFRLMDHLQRLSRSLKVARVDSGLSLEEMQRISEQVLEANRPLMSPADDCWLVHNISRGLMLPGPSPQQTRSATVIVYTQHLDLAAGRDTTGKVAMQ